MENSSLGETEQRQQEEEVLLLSQSSSSLGRLGLALLIPQDYL